MKRKPALIPVHSGGEGRGAERRERGEEREEEEEEDEEEDDKTEGTLSPMRLEGVVLLISE